MRKLLAFAAVLLLTFAVCGCGEEVPRTEKVDSANGYSINTYNDMDVCVRMDVYNREDVLQQTIEYRDKGTRMKNTYYNTDGTIHMRHQYNDKEVCTKTTEYTDGRPRKYGEHFYDNYGTRLHTIWYDMNNVKQTMHEYQNSFDLVRTTFYNADGSVKDVIEYK